MKNLILFTMFIFSISFAFSQAPEKINYQAVVRDGNGNIVNGSNGTVSIQISILQGSSTGTEVYKETFFETPNSYGLVNLAIGNGTVVSGTFSSINWGNDSYWIKTEIDINGGTNYTISGESQFFSVPYALYAKSSGSSSLSINDLSDGNTEGIDHSFASPNTTNVFLGNGSGVNVTYGYQNVGLGVNALNELTGNSPSSNTSNRDNTAIGYRSQEKSRGVGNTSLGSLSLLNNTSGLSWNGFSYGGGSFNTAIGTSSLSSHISGNFNTAIGYGSLSSLQSGERNISIGNSSGSNVTGGSYNVFIGEQAGIDETGSYKLYIDNKDYNNSNPPLIYGEFANSQDQPFLTFGGNAEVLDSLKTKYFQFTENSNDGYILQSDNLGNASWIDPTTLNTANDGDWSIVNTDLASGVSGNVGIGTSIPEEKLDVRGNFYLNNESATQTILKIKNDNADQYSRGTLSFINTNTNSGSNNTGLSIMYEKSDASSTGNSTFIFRQGEVSGEYLDYLHFSESTKDITFNANKSAGSTSSFGDVIIENGNLELQNGNLELQNGTSINEFSTDGTLVGNSDDALPTEKAVKTYIDNSVSTNSYWSRNSSSGYVYSSISTDKIGIGTNTPQDKLHIEGSNYANSSLRFLNLASSNQDYWNLGVRDFGSGNEYFSIERNNSSGNGTTPFVVTDDGYVGIGTTAPKGLIDLYIPDPGNTNSTDLNNSDNYPLKITSGEWLGNQVTGIEFWNGSPTANNRKTVPTARIISRMAGNGSDGEDLLFQTQPSDVNNPNQTQPTTKMIIENDGNVGIGTDSPEEKLHVAGNIKMTNSGRLRFDDGAYIMEAASDNDLWINTSNELHFAKNGGSNIYIGSSGTMAVKTTAYATISLNVGGDINYTGTLYNNSDIRLKENIKEIKSVNNNLMKIQAYQYNMKDDPLKKVKYGLIAQDVEKVFPELVLNVEEGGFKTLSYIQLVPILIEGHKEQQLKIKSLEEMILIQEKKINDLQELIINK